MKISKSVKQFYETAREYCRWAEGDISKDENKVYTALKLLASLYYQALLLPEVEPEDEAPEESGLTKLKCKNIYKRFKSLPFQYYSLIFQPITTKPEKPVKGDIADDLMDIYIDLKEGILLHEKHKTNDAIFQWRISFGLHWGRHATSALRALHCYETEN